jgi:hypothetical protein
MIEIDIDAAVRSIKKMLRELLVQETGLRAGIATDFV